MEVIAIVSAVCTTAWLVESIIRMLRHIKQA
jgi:hypothetical protein